MKTMTRSLLVLVLVSISAPALAAKPPLTLETVRQAINERWKDVRDLTVVDRATRIRYHRLMGLIDFPKMDQTPLSERPNVWRAAAGFEYLQVWDGGRWVTAAYNGAVTRIEGRRSAFGPLEGRIIEGNHVPFDDLSFAYYVGRFGRNLGLADFLAMPTTHLVKAHTRLGDIPCCRVKGVARMALGGAPKPYVVTMELAAPYGWLPLRTRVVDPKTGFIARQYHVRSFSNVNGFPFPHKAQIDYYEVGHGHGPQARPRPIRTSSLIYTVEKVAVNQRFGPADFALHFAPGTEVHDERTGQVYRVPVAGKPAE